MNDLQRENWLNMINRLREFQQHQMRLGELVHYLESAFDSCEFPESEMVRRWWDLFQNLEIRNAKSDESETTYLEASEMQQFMEAQISIQK